MDRCGLDVHKDSIFACILDSHGEKVFEQRFGTLTSELNKLPWKSQVSIGYLFGVLYSLTFR
jgi:hypothetical protein